MTLVEMEPAVADAYMVLVEATDAFVHRHDNRPIAQFEGDPAGRLDDAQDAFCNALEGALTPSEDMTPPLTESVAQQLAAELVELRERVNRMEDVLRDLTRDTGPGEAPEIPLSISEEADCRYEAQQKSENAAEIRRIQDFAAAWDAHTDPGRAWTRSQP